MTKSQLSFHTSTSSFRPGTQEKGESLTFNHVTQKQQFCYALKRKYGSTMAAWRSAFDPKATGVASFGTFMVVLEECAFHGNIKSLWDDVCGPAWNKSTITFQDIDPEAHLLLQNVRAQL